MFYDNVYQIDTTDTTTSSTCSTVAACGGFSFIKLAFAVFAGVGAAIGLYKAVKLIDEFVEVTKDDYKEQQYLKIIESTNEELNITKAEHFRVEEMIEHDEKQLIDFYDEKTQERNGPSKVWEAVKEELIVKRNVKQRLHERIIELALKIDGYMLAVTDLGNYHIEYDSPADIYTLVPNHPYRKKR